ncbi:hypothetical protein [Candidatus Enterococcus mansonii]|uniref:Uncharacterized protein n=1 Tax=Candidatus Enterococcus mansonii TaxID=1834181 RepID=A0A242CI59_9ENTE|nr:hypothetical protein [Enterococcus sp. 4G2_DIV0659]OTO09915.1 hypothetical protein A5880_000598 [Enterococcus sp. 4G2_DIV0659]
MKKIRPQNPVYLILCVVIPWRFINTYYVLSDDNFTISRYYARKNSTSFDRKVDTLDLKKLVKFGLPKDLGTALQEPTCHGAKGTYISQEIQFLFEDGTIISWNVRPYTKKQLRQLVALIYLRCQVTACERLQKVLRIKNTFK